MWFPSRQPHKTRSSTLETVTFCSGWYDFIILLHAKIKDIKNLFSWESVKWNIWALNYNNTWCCLSWCMNSVTEQKLLYLLEVFLINDINSVFKPMALSLRSHQRSLTGSLLFQHSSHLLQNARQERWAPSCWQTQWARMGWTSRASCTRLPKSSASAADGSSSTWIRTSYRVRRKQDGGYHYRLIKLLKLKFEGCVMLYI